MSFCRFSDNNFQCDFYAYESNAGFQLHLAASRVQWDPPENPYDLRSLERPPEVFQELVRNYHEQLTQAPRTTISLQDAGESFRFDSLGELRDALAGYIELGFQAPDWLLPSIDEELNEELNQDPGRKNTDACRDHNHPERGATAT